MPDLTYQKKTCGYRKPIDDGKDRSILGMSRELSKRLAKTPDLVSKVTLGRKEISQPEVLSNLVEVLEEINGSNRLDDKGRVDLSARRAKLKDAREQLAETLKQYGFKVKQVGSKEHLRLTVLYKGTTIYEPGLGGVKRIEPDYDEFGGLPIQRREEY